MSRITVDYESRDHLFRLLDTNGDGTGTKNANGNYSGAADDFYIQPPAGETYVLYRMLVFIEDGTSAFSADNYGGTASALTTGVKVLVTDSSDTTIVDLLDNVPVKSNAQWNALCYDAQFVSYGTGNKYLVVRWTFERSGVPIVLTDQQKLKVTVNDDLSGLDTHHFRVQGFRTRLYSGEAIR